MPHLLDRETATELAGKIEVNSWRLRVVLDCSSRRVGKAPKLDAAQNEDIDR